MKDVLVSSMSFRDEGNFNSPASPKRRGGGRGRDGTFGNSAAMKNPYYLTINYTKKRGYPEG